MLFVCAHCGQPGASRSDQAFGSQVCDDINGYVWHHPSCLVRKTSEESISYYTCSLSSKGRTNAIRSSRGPKVSLGPRDPMSKVWVQVGRAFKPVAQPLRRLQHQDSKLQSAQKGFRL